MPTTVNAAPTALTFSTPVRSMPTFSTTKEMAQTVMRPCTVYELIPTRVPLTTLIGYLVRTSRMRENPSRSGFRQQDARERSVSASRT